MKQLYIIANWKENMTQTQTSEWLTQIASLSFQTVSEKIVIVCPPFTLLFLVKQFIRQQQLSLQLGAQNISRFVGGAHTGEESGVMLKDFVRYVIIGHSERRAMGENDEILREKVMQALQHNLIPIYCVSTQNMTVPHGVTIVAYEPIIAIGSGNPDSPENANSVANVLKQRFPFIKAVLYGGSVTGENVGSFTACEQINGVLLGKASLEAASFYSLIQNS